MQKVSGVIEKGRQHQVRATTNLGLTKKQVAMLFSFADKDDAYLMQELLTRATCVVSEVVD